MKVKEESEKVGLKLNILKTKITAHSTVTSWQIDEETMETVRDFIFLGSKITADDDCSHDMKRQLAPWKKSYDQSSSVQFSRSVVSDSLPRQCIKKQRHYFTLPTKVHPSQSYGFSSSHVCESWTIKKAEGQIIDAFELWCWRRLLRVPWTARRSNQSILKDLSGDFFGRNYAKAETPVLWPPHVKSSPV